MDFVYKKLTSPEPKGSGEGDRGVEEESELDKWLKGKDNTNPSLPKPISEQMKIVRLNIEIPKIIRDKFKKLAIDNETTVRTMVVYGLYAVLETELSVAHIDTHEYKELESLLDVLRRFIKVADDIEFNVIKKQLTGAKKEDYFD